MYCTVWCTLFFFLLWLLSVLNEMTNGQVNAPLIGGKKKEKLCENAPDTKKKMFR